MSASPSSFEAEPVAAGEHLFVTRFATRLPAPVVAGQIKRTPTDFVVIEDLGFEPEGSGEHVYLDIIKVGANTGWVARQIADFAGIRPMDVGYGGRKDRHAVTRQWFSCYLPVSSAEPDWQNLDIEGVELKNVTRHRAKLRTGEIAGNHFELVVYFDSLQPAGRQDLEDRLDYISRHGFPNYFGTQRFGRENQNLDAADRLLRQREKAQGDRGMLISAARSYLFNLYLSEQLEAGVGSSEDVLALTGPLIGKSRDPQPGEATLDEHLQGWVSGLRRLGAKVAERKLFVLPVGLQWQFSENQLALQFSLPTGSYATSLLQELVVDVDKSGAGT